MTPRKEPSAVLYMWMSLDGFVGGPGDVPGRTLGRGGERLHNSLGDGEEG